MIWAFLKGLSPQFWFTLAGAVGVMVLLGAVYHAGGKSARADYRALVERDAGLAAAAQAEKLRLEKQYAQHVTDATRQRDAALSGLQALAASSPSPTPDNPRAPEGSKQVCFESGAYTAAFQRFGTKLAEFLRGAKGLAFEGDVSTLDARALLEAWPR